MRCLPPVVLPATMPTTPYTLHERNGYPYLDEGPASDLPAVVLLHGMLGDVSNWTHTVGSLARNGYRVLVPLLPVYDLPLTQTSVTGLASYVRGFIKALEMDGVVIAGNSLGGHVALLYTLAYPQTVSALVLSGASGIYEVGMGTSTMRRRDREYIRERAAFTFYDPVHATPELVDQVYDVVNNRGRALRLIRMARSTQAETVLDRIRNITIPTLLVWGREDAITPPDVAETFRQHITQSQLYFIEQCGHAPMMEHPETFDRLLLDFLRHTTRTPALMMAS